MQKKLLRELIKELEKEMLRLGYSEGTMDFYRRQWHKILKFAQERGETHFSEQLGLDFLEKHYNIFEKDIEKTLSKSDAYHLRIIRMLGDFQLHHTILRRYYKHKEILKDSYFIEIRNRFKQYCIDKDYSTVTIDHYVKQSSRFMDYLVSQKVNNCRNINFRAPEIC